MTAQYGLTMGTPVWMRWRPLGLPVVAALIACFLAACGTTSTGRPGDFPPLPSDAGDDRAAPPVAVTTKGPHKFKHSTPSGRAVSFDPCRPIHYVINTTNMPDKGADMVREALDQISQASGFTFTDDGTTDEAVPTGERAPVQERYGDKWAPIMFAWADQANVPALAGSGGLGVNYPISPSGPESERYTTGMVVLNFRYFADWQTRRNGYQVTRASVMHLTMLVLGLDDVGDRRELMGRSSTSDKLGPGDRQGLAMLGTAPCFSDT